ncbi:hypothetical protein COCSUDRAFT_56655 [Coccomyxa subellipsoidea C-169]|uniref:Uncharacterized protein n=1 Tax=Coccomyxa subellipsoidea (strain C-169) TaxID=574566 RepID=I0YSR6_COCSC|nr:hypothetical protein COCSUDRAFT_56655 [Coccomyxa subellipsoidea C-169]EIE21435.1 hypothetical protein COCSUDRAFT_56655 [Coccomyxa subellipsoidea C-169]|eukprot:XP_005645979.1 hypothetical protein COCSUDRAFT_56655 [Coccomyxa subellipsoidea C-169]
MFERDSEESAQHTTLPLEDGAIPEVRDPADGLEPPHPSHARLARSAAEALAQAASTTTGHEEEQTSEQQPFATAKRASQESAGSHNDEAQAASLRRQQAAPAANVPSREQAEYGLRSHLEAFEAGSTAAPVFSSQLSQDIEISNWRNPAADDVVPDFAELDL